MTGTTLRVKGLADLLRVVDAEPKLVKRDVRRALREIAIPVRDEATALFLSEVTPDPAKTKFGISVRKAGTITVEQRKRRSAIQEHRRPNFTGMQRHRALEPALWNNEARVVQSFQGVLDDLERRWNRAGA